MQYKTKIVLLLLIGSFLFPDSFKYNSPNNQGIIGLINIPSARFYDESSTTLTLYKGNPDSKLTLSLTPYDWLEASIFYTSIEGRPYGSGFDQDYKDKGFNVKFRVRSEDNFPAIAIGLNDVGGTGIYSSEYIVSSYGLDKLDLHFGLGWGRMSGGNLQINNFLGDLDQSFFYRNAEISNGGKLRIKDYFSGKKIGLFGGLSYLVNDKFLFKAEYDSTDIPLNQGFPIRSSNYSFGLEFLDYDDFVIALNYERGDYFGLKFSWKSNSQNFSQNPYNNDIRAYKTPHEKLRFLLNANNIGVNNIQKKENSLLLEVQENSYKDFQELKANVNKAITDSGFDIEKVIKKYKVAGLETFLENHELVSNSSKTEVIYERRTNPSFHAKPNLVLRPFIAGREGFLKYALLAELNTQYIFSDNLFWTSNLKYALWQNFDELYIPAVNTYPYPVRSDIKDYLNNFENNIILGRSQIDYFKSLSSDQHVQISAGIFEEMFSGYGIEYLWNKPELPFAIGFEMFKAYKRDYKLHFELQDYSNLTGHVNLYYENEYILPLSVHLSYGEYLAGDVGFTFDISRRFKNGVSMGAFFTRTDVTAEQFGEGSFDKGIYFTIPLNGEWFNYSWRPLTKDPGSKLIRSFTLYDFHRKFKN